MQKCRRPRVRAVEMMGLAHQLTLEAYATLAPRAEAICSYRAALPKYWCVEIQAIALGSAEEEELR